VAAALVVVVVGGAAGGRTSALGAAGVVVAVLGVLAVAGNGPADAAPVDVPQAVADTTVRTPRLMTVRTRRCMITPMIACAGHARFRLRGRTARNWVRTGMQTMNAK